MNKPKYYYAPRFNHFNIYQRDENGDATRIDDRATKEEARKEVYRLNGWEYKPKEDATDNKKSTGFSR